MIGNMQSLSSDLGCALAATSIPAPLNHPDAILDMVEDERLRILPEMALAYARGDFGLIKLRFSEIEGDGAIKLCACQLMIPAAISTGDYTHFLEVEAYLKKIVEANVSAPVATYAELILASGYLGAGAPNMVPDWLKNGDFTALPQQAKRNAAYMRVQYFRWQGNAELTLALAQTSLAFCESDGGVTLEDIYLRLHIGAACYALGRHDEATRHILDALKKSVPHGFIAPLAELLPIYGGLMERLLKQAFPAHYDAVFALWKRIYPNWITFHNRFTKDHITLILTLREYEIAMLAVRRVPYAKIAEQQHISVSRLKAIMDVIHDKLLVKNRKELARFIL